MSEEEIQTIAERVNKTTKGNWTAFIEGRDFTSGSSFIMTGSEKERGEDIEFVGASSDDIDFIANAKQDIPKLINEIRRLKNVIQNLKR